MPALQLLLLHLSWTNGLQVTRSRTSRSLLGPSLGPACDISENYDFGKHHLEDLKEYCNSFLYEFKEFLEEVDSHPTSQDDYYMESTLKFLGVQLEVITDLVLWQLQHKDIKDDWAEDAFRQPLRQLRAMERVCLKRQQSDHGGGDDYERIHDEAEVSDDFAVPGTPITNCAQTFSSFHEAVLEYIGAPRSSNFGDHESRGHSSEEDA